LPDSVDSDNAKALFKDGILKVSIPKAEKSKRKNIGNLYKLQFQFPYSEKPEIL
jgi:hypothetical protein